MRLASCLATAAVAMTLCAPAEAAATNWVTIRADRSASATVTVPRPLELLLGEPGDKGPVVTISGGGKAAGFFLTPTRGGESVGQLAVDGARFSKGSEREPVAAGRYVLRVVADAPVTIRVPVAGRAATWRARSPLTAGRADAAWDVPAGPVIVGGTPVSLRASSVVLFALTFTGNGVGTNTVVCLTDPNGICGPDEGAWQATGNSTSTGPRINYRGGMSVFAEDLPAGAHHARWRVTADGAVASPAAFVYIVH